MGHGRLGVVGRSLDLGAGTTRSRRPDMDLPAHSQLGEINGSADLAVVLVNDLDDFESRVDDRRDAPTTTRGGDRYPDCQGSEHTDEKN